LKLTQIFQKKSRHNDGISYEKAAITEQLTKYKTTPKGSQSMKDDQSVDDVLVPNINLRQLIEGYRREHNSSLKFV
jgi:hypothetical protein